MLIAFTSTSMPVNPEDIPTRAPKGAVEQATEAKKPIELVKAEQEANARVTKEPSADAPLADLACVFPGREEAVTAKKPVGTYPKMKKHMRNTHPESEE